MTNKIAKMGELTYRDKDGNSVVMYPYTKAECVAGIENIISNIDAEYVYYGDGIGSEPVPINADLLQGKSASYFENMISNHSSVFFGEGEDTPIIDETLNKIYPVGSVYLSVNSTNPSTLFGGIWEQVSQGRALFGAGTLNDITYTADSTVDAGLPNITGTGHYADNNGSWSGALYNAGSANYIGDGSSSGTLLGFDASRSNSIYGNSDTVQPNAFVVYMWKRVS